MRFSFLIVLLFLIYNRGNSQNISIPDSIEIVKKLTLVEGKESSVKAFVYKRKGLKEFPNEIRLMDSLVYLDLSHNRIDSIPHWINELKHLKYIKLVGNRIYKLNDSFFES